MVLAHGIARATAATGGRPLLLEESGRDCYVYYSFNKLLGHPTAQRDESPDQTIDAVQVLRLDLRV